MGIKTLDLNTVRQTPAASLAFVGDAIFDLYIRTVLLEKRPRVGSNVLNNEKIKYVKASMQANIAIRIMDSLSEEEQAVLKRGRNAKSQTVPKNAKLSDYKYATGFEALLGYLMLLGRDDRVREILETSMRICLGEEGLAGDD
jgi:ribonuclease-3 family protein